MKPKTQPTKTRGSGLKILDFYVFHNVIQENDFWVFNFGPFLWWELTHVQYPMKTDCFHLKDTSIIQNFNTSLWSTFLDEDTNSAYIWYSSEFMGCSVLQTPCLSPLCIFSPILVKQSDYHSLFKGKLRKQTWRQQRSHRTGQEWKADVWLTQWIKEKALLLLGTMYPYLERNNNKKKHFNSTWIKIWLFVMFFPQI